MMHVRLIKIGLFVAASLCFSGVFAKAEAKDYGKPYVGEVVEYEARYEDTFVHLARDYNLGFVEMRAANPNVDPWIPGEGTDLVLPGRHLLPDVKQEDVVINLPEQRLYKFFDDGREPETFPIGIGREGLSTPLGTTTVVRRVAGPTWYPTERMRKEKPELEAVVPPGPENPMGSHALYLGWPTYAIHGTNRPFGIGRRSSSGCIRLYPEGITKLYDLVPLGTKVTVVDQPIKVAWIDDELYLEAHPDVEQAIQMEEIGYVMTPSLKETGFEQIIKVAGEYQDRLRWPAIRTAIRERRGYPIKIGSRPRSASDDNAVDEAQEVSAVDEAAEEPKPVQAEPEAELEALQTADTQEALDEAIESGEGRLETPPLSGLNQ
jgi:L,D-transpeptidase ErfK/SrfK